MRRATAIVGAVFIFTVIFLIVDFFAMRITDGLPPWAWIGGTVLAGLIALAMAYSSYKATMRKRI